MTIEEKIKSDEQRLSFLNQLAQSYERNIDKSARKERTHLLCQIGGSMLKHFPELDIIPPDDINDFIYQVSSLPDVDGLFKDLLKRFSK